MSNEKKDETDGETGLSWGDRLAVTFGMKKLKVDGGEAEQGLNKTLAQGQSVVDNQDINEGYDPELEDLIIAGLFGGNGDVKKFFKAIATLHNSIQDPKECIVSALAVLDLKPESVVSELRKAFLSGFDGQKQAFEQKVLGPMSQNVEKQSSAIQELETRRLDNVARLEEIQKLLAEIEQQKTDAEKKLNVLKEQVTSKRRMYESASSVVKQRLQLMLEQFSTLK